MTTITLSRLNEFEGAVTKVLRLFDAGEYDDACHGFAEDMLSMHIPVPPDQFRVLLCRCMGEEKRHLFEVTLREFATN